MSAVVYSDSFDRDLAIRAKTDTVALDRLVRHYEGFVRSISSRYFIYGATAEDVQQEARIGLMNAVRSYDPQSLTAFTVFAAICIERAVISAVIGSRRIKHLSLTESVREGVTDRGARVMAVDLIEGIGTDPAHVFEMREQIGRLLAAISLLSPMERRAVLGIAGGLSYAEIDGCAPGVKPKWIDNAVQRARLKLRDAA